MTWKRLKNFTCQGMWAIYMNLYSVHTMESYEKKWTQVVYCCFLYHSHIIITYNGERVYLRERRYQYGFPYCFPYGDKYEVVYAVPLCFLLFKISTRSARFWMDRQNHPTSLTFLFCFFFAYLKIVNQKRSPSVQGSFLTVAGRLQPQNLKSTCSPWPCADLPITSSFLLLSVETLGALCSYCNFLHFCSACSNIRTNCTVLFMHKLKSIQKSYRSYILQG